MVDDWSNKSVLVTGGRGFLGSHLVAALEAKGCRDLSAPSRAECDFREDHAVETILKKKKWDVVFHLAASVGGIGANQDHPADFFYDNAMMGLQLIHGSAKAKVGRLVLLGTICAYPKFAPIPFKEDELWNGYPEETNAPYGVAKRSLLVGAEGYRLQYGLNYTAVFPTNLYGPRDDFDLHTSHVIPALIRKCEEAKNSKAPSISLWGTGAPSRDFLYVKDAVEGILLAGEKPGIEGQIFNLGSEREIRIKDLAEMIARITGFGGTYQWDSTKPDGQPRRCVSNERARSILGFEPRYNLERGIEETVRWYREQSRSSS